MPIATTTGKTARTDAADLWRQSSFIWLDGLVVDSSWMVPADTREKRPVTIRKLTQPTGRQVVRFTVRKVNVDWTRSTPGRRVMTSECSRSRSCMFRKTTRNK